MTVGEDIYVIDTSVTELPASSEVVGDKVAPPAAPTTGAAPERLLVPVPIMGESITQGVLAKWTVKTGDVVVVDEVVASIETDKVRGLSNIPFTNHPHYLLFPLIYFLL